jgi:hypothetical protein
MTQPGQMVRYRDTAGTSWPAVVVGVVATQQDDPDRRPLDLRAMCDSDTLVLVKGVERCPEGDEVPNTWGPA